MTREEAIKKRDEQIADIREWVRNSDDAWEYGAVLSVIDEIVDEIKICDKRIEALQERPKGRCECCEDGRTFVGHSRIFCSDNKFHKVNYCLNCGAPMVGADMRESEQE